MTKVLCPFVPGELNPETRDALYNYAPRTEFVDVSYSDKAYWLEVKRRWTGAEDLVIIEQDIVITDDTIPSFDDCSAMWCTYAYDGYIRGLADPGISSRWRSGKLRGILLYDALGCVRFSAELQRREPLTCAMTPEAEDSVAVPWWFTDYVIQDALRRKYHVCCHGLVEHHQTKRDWNTVGTGPTKLFVGSDNPIALGQQ